MIKPQHAILRFAKYKGPEVSRIEAHNERTAAARQKKEVQFTRDTA